MKPYKKALFFFIFQFGLFSFSSSAMMEADDIPSGKCFIRNVHHGEYLYVEETSTHEGFTKSMGSPSISSQSIFMLEKRQEGLLIKNLYDNTYLYAADVNWGDSTLRCVRASKNITSNSYFEVMKRDGNYIFKNKKYSDYMHLSSERNSSKYNPHKLVFTDKTILTSSYFAFKQYVEGLF